MTKSLSALLAPPTEADVSAAVSRFETLVRARFGTNVARILVFGSRARGDARPDSDVDVAAVFRNQPPATPPIVLELGEIAYMPLVEFGVEIAPVPFTEVELADPSRSTNPALARVAKLDGLEFRATTRNLKVSDASAP